MVVVKVLMWLFFFVIKLVSVVFGVVWLCCCCSVCRCGMFGSGLCLVVSLCVLKFSVLLCFIVVLFSMMLLFLWCVGYSLMMLCVCSELLVIICFSSVCVLVNSLWVFLLCRGLVRMFG